MVHLLLDADAVIKLHRSGVLANVVGAVPCTIPQAVYDEVVTRGKARLHLDAEAIQGIIAGAVTIVSTQERRQPELGLGAGEIGILDLLSQGQEDPIVVSDDRRFLTLLSTQGILFLTPSDLLVMLARRGILAKAAAREALERLRPMIRRAAYLDARQDLEFGGETHEED